MKIGKKQEQWIRDLESDTPFYSYKTRKLICRALFNDVGLTEQQMAKNLREHPDLYFESSV